MAAVRAGIEHSPPQVLSSSGAWVGEAGTQEKSSGSFFLIPSVFWHLL
jgi:hypothetical protein